MSKRFTESKIWEDPWYQDLPPKYKLFWKYVCDKCGLSGAWSVNMRLAEFQIGTSLKQQEAFELFNKEKERVKDCGGIWLLVDFVAFQYGTLHPDKVRFHKSIQEEIDRLSHRLSNGLSHSPKEEEGDGEEDKEGEGDWEKNVPSPENGKTAFGELGKVLLTAEEYKKLQAKHPAARLQKAIEILDGYIASKNVKYASHYAVLKDGSWVWDRVAEQAGPPVGRKPTIAEAMAQ